MEERGWGELAFPLDPEPAAELGLEPASEVATEHEGLEDAEDPEPTSPARARARFFVVGGDESVDIRAASALARRCEEQQGSAVT